MATLLFYAIVILVAFTLLAITQRQMNKGRTGRWESFKQEYVKDSRHD